MKLFALLLIWSIQVINIYAQPRIAAISQQFQTIPAQLPVADTLDTSRCVVYYRYFYPVDNFNDGFTIAEDRLTLQIGEQVSKTFSYNLHLWDRNITYGETNKFRIHSNMVNYEVFNNHSIGQITVQHRIPYSRILQRSTQVVEYDEPSTRIEWQIINQCDTDFGSQPSSLRVTPMLYPEVFDSPADYPNALQTLDSRRFRTRNFAYTSYTVRRWSFFLNAGFNAQLEHMDSELAPMNADRQTLPAADSMRNNIYWRKLDLLVGPSISYRIGDKFSATLSMPLDFMSLRSEDKIRETVVRSNRLFAAPSFSLQTTVTYNLKFSARASYNELVGGLYDTYGGYIMTDYRMIANRQGDVLRDQRQNYTASLSYGNAIRALFGSVDIDYYRSNRNLMYGTTYEGSLSRIEAVAMDNRSDGYNLAAKVSKRFDGIATTVNLSGGFSQSWNEVLRQGELLPTRYDRTSAGLSFNTRFTQAVRLDYGGEYSRSESWADDKTLQPIDMVRQHAALDFIIRKKFICRIGGEHCYNAAIGGRDRNMFFLDASLSYKGKRVEYMLEGRNLLDTGTFRSVSQSDITDYVYSYKLRPASVMLKIKFSLK